MTTQRALVHESKGVAVVKSDVPLPELPEDYILVKTKAVALNPTDWKSLHNKPVAGAVAGCDYAGIVEKIGSKVTAGLKVGDRVAGFVRGGGVTKRETGAFAQYINSKGGIQLKLADHVSFEDASTLGVGITTVGQGLYQSLGLPLPPAKVEKPTSILIYGASTATGTLAVQFAKLSGLEVIATSSPHNFDLLKSLGADQVFDYKDPDVGAKIREATNDELYYVFDTISEHGSPEISGQALSSKGGRYAALLYATVPRANVHSTVTMGYTVTGEHYNPQWPANPEDYIFGVKFWKLSEDLINSGKIKTHPTEVRSGGLGGIAQGLNDLKDNKVSGVKLVYKIE
ncbi:GroES-like protein [Aaosphaeria arxii CBS 175.79]|uniref:GroES-like protein n=1 Tax=Aaosphaeria arxii CBS 175.79 TaxID=1450172 RepID=A0A6A5XAA1_9PLEO|nr:GroES-like protein [Aaosphaeria arxii CBS 175.79]KAF2009697.1 GroES-like protein [Aaosphaeria arxii CBS 175.79]